jgi:hypothetical protein
VVRSTLRASSRVGLPTGLQKGYGGSPSRSSVGEVAEERWRGEVFQWRWLPVGSDDRQRVMWLEEVEGGETWSLIRRRGTRSGGSPREGRGGSVSMKSSSDLRDTDN